LASNALAAAACVSTNMAAAAAGLTWMFMSHMKGGNASILGFASGSVCGLVAITPAAGYTTIWSSIIIGAGGSFFSYLFCHYKSRFIFNKVEDTLDVFGCHGISGIWGAIGTGLFAQEYINPSVDGNSHNGSFFGNGPLLGK